MELEDVSFQFLREITNDFSEDRVLGAGAFGVVYRGVTKNGQDVAVKKLKHCYADLHNKQFRHEFHNLSKLKHQNIIQILGYCYETERIPFIMPDGNKELVDETHTALCFEYLCNGSLQKHLSDELCERKLDWQKRFKIIKGTCEGLKYMHKDLDKHIYHLDLKPDNILLDKDMMPKIADFGLSIIFDKEHPYNPKCRLGTPGYQPPEHIDRGEINEKFDIFSLGVVIIMIVSAQEGYSKCQNMSSDEFVDRVKKSWRNRLQATCSSNSLLEAYCHQVERCTHIALDCVKSDSQERPCIVKIIEELNEIETDICKHPQEKMGKERNDILGGHPNIMLQTDSGCSDLEVIDVQEISSDVVEELIVGRTGEQEKIIASLLECISKKITILPIYGIGGIGKTTFARLIYKDPKFNIYSRVWVYVSQIFDLHQIQKSIISQLSENVSHADERQMIDSCLTKLHSGNKIMHADDTQMIDSCLTKLLSGKKIMIVLDDIWEDNPFHLQQLKDMIYHDDSNIIILVTTRSEHVAERVCTNLQPYKILPLTEEMCWDIIKQRSCFKDRDDKEQLMDIGQEIAQKCGGVALAARSLGFTLRSMNFHQWIKVKDSHIWNEHVSKDLSLPTHVHASLMLSYNNMSQCLKTCFAYCATFPKAHKIVKDDLIYQWISLDFIKPTLLSKMEICEKYIVQLLGLSFFQQSVSPKTSEANHKQATVFTVHDLVHDLAISLLGTQILVPSQQGNTMGSSCKYALLSDCNKPLELCLTSRAGLMALRFLDGCRSKVISGAIFAPASRSLRVLDLNGCSIILPDSIGQLRQLRYLNAPGIQGIMVPESITKLSNLVYLNLHKSRIEQLPKSIGQMGSLIHLDLSACLFLQFKSSLGNLERLVHLDLSHCHGIIPESLRSLSRLEHLNVSWSRSIGCLPRAMGGLKKLRYLNLSRATCFGLQEVLVNLTKLAYLNLKASLNDRLVVEAGLDSLLERVSSLSNLEYLNLGSNRELRTIPETIGNLRKLNTLDLSFCENLQRLPASISVINSLEFLYVSGCGKLDKSTLPQNKNNSALLSHLVVYADNLFEMEDKHPTSLEIRRLENVKSADEAERIKLAQKQSIGYLELAWTRIAKRFVDDQEVLRKLEPPGTLKRLTLKGYSSISFPSWMISIATYLPHLEKVVLEDLPSCNILPPLGQLPNLKWLKIQGMDSIRKIDGDLYGSRRAFPRLVHFSLSRMECLEEWNTAYSIGEDGSENELAFPKLYDIHIDRCPSLRFKACLSLSPANEYLHISRSDKVLLSSWVNRGHASVSSYAGTTRLSVTCCEAPLHRWSLLRLLPCLTFLRITDCSDLTCNSTDLLPCISSLKTLIVEGRDRENTIVALPERLGDLTSLRNLKIDNCKGIKALPDSVQQLSCLRRLEINDCPQLVRWCESEENAMKLAQIQHKILNDKPLRVMSQRAKWRTQD